MSLYNPLDKVYSQRNLVKSNIEKMYAKADTDLGKVNKSNEPDLIKSGEGSKGGKVIGHTKSGKPIYDTHDHPDHKGFSKQDHNDAFQEQAKAIRDSGNGEKSGVTSNQIEAKKHINSMMAIKDDSFTENAKKDADELDSQIGIAKKKFKNVTDSGGNINLIKHKNGEYNYNFHPDHKVGDRKHKDGSDMSGEVVHVISGKK